MLLLAVFLLGAVGCAARQGPTPLSAPARLQRVYVVATAHDFHLKPEFGYTLSDLKAQITSYRPDLVCGEVMAEDYGQAEWMYPLEAAVVEDAALGVQAVFYPADWRPHRAPEETPHAVNAMNAEEKKRYDEAYGDFMPRFTAAFGPELFDFIHAKSTLRLLRRVHDTMIMAAGDIGAGFWEARNQMIVKNCMRRADSLGAQVVVFAFGADHKYGIEDYLRRFYGIAAQPVQRRFVHGNEPVSERVRTKWQRIYRDLQTDVEQDAVPIGLRNGYDVEKRLRFWQRMAGADGTAH